jgi:hypothetical protein
MAASETGYCGRIGPAKYNILNEMPWTVSTLDMSIEAIDVMNR